MNNIIIIFILLMISINKSISNYLFINIIITSLLVISNKYAFYINIFFKKDIIVLL